MAPVPATSPQQAIFPSPLPCHAEPRVAADDAPVAIELWKGRTDATPRECQDSWGRVCPQGPQRQGGSW